MQRCQTDRSLETRRKRGRRDLVSRLPLLSRRASIFSTTLADSPSPGPREELSSLRWLLARSFCCAIAIRSQQPERSHIPGDKGKVHLGDRKPISRCKAFTCFSFGIFVLFLVLLDHEARLVNVVGPAQHAGEATDCPSWEKEGGGGGGGVQNT